MSQCGTSMDATGVDWPKALVRFSDATTAE